MKLLRIIKSPNPAKKWRAEFDNGRHTDFGATGYQDYTQSKDPVRRANYLSRHHNDLRTRDPTAPGFLSYYVLWGDSPSMAANIASYKKRFNL
jgi:hypothetical protein